MTERVLSQVQQEDVGFLLRVHGVTLPDKSRSCEISKVLNVDPVRVDRSQLRWFRHVIRMSQEILARQVLLAAHKGK